MTYVVIENTPGYLPEDDEPATFDSYDEAAKAAIEQALRYMDDPDGDFTVSFTYRKDDFVATIEDHQKMHDLGRVITIMEVEDDKGTA